MSKYPVITEVVIGGKLVQWKKCTICKRHDVFTSDVNAVCAYCESHDNEYADSTCEKCGYVGVSTDLHHIHGRKVSNETIRLCCNCHAEQHRKKRTL